jgi:ferritin-like metal-binding protein YciE
MIKLDTLQDLFVEELHDLHSAEEQLVQALPKLAQAASHEELREAFEHHLQETQDHVRRLDDIYGELGIPASSEKCEAMEGLIAEGEQLIQAQGDPAVKDAALIGAAQRVEHYEIAAYGTARELAKQLGHEQAEELLDQTLDEESNADKLLNKIATGGIFASGINQRAQQQ